jgi:hypothetical protein
MILDPGGSFNQVVLRLLHSCYHRGGAAFDDGLTHPVSPSSVVIFKNAQRGGTLKLHLRDFLATNRRWGFIRK